MFAEQDIDGNAKTMSYLEFISVLQKAPTAALHPPVINPSIRP